MSTVALVFIVSAHIIIGILGVIGIFLLILNCIRDKEFREGILGFLVLIVILGSLIIVAEFWSNRRYSDIAAVQVEKVEVPQPQQEKR